MSVASVIRSNLSSFAGNAIDNWAIQRAARQWGIFLRHQGRQPGAIARVPGDDVNSLLGKAPKRILSAAHVETLSIQEESSISRSLQETGGFFSYDKIFEPFTATIRFICDGSETGSLAGNLLPGWLKGTIRNSPDRVRKDFVTTLASLVKDTNLYFIATPERIYSHANIVSYQIERKTDGGVDLIVTEVKVQEVRSTRKTGWVTVKYPQGAQTRNNGIVTATPKDST